MTKPMMEARLAACEALAAQLQATVDAQAEEIADLKRRLAELAGDQ